MSIQDREAEQQDGPMIPVESPRRHRKGESRQRARTGATATPLVLGVELGKDQNEPGDGAVPVRTSTRAERRSVLKIWRRGGAPLATLDDDAPEAPDAWAGLDIYSPQGAVLRQKVRPARRGAYAPRAAGAPTTTRQGEILNPALLASPPNTNAIAIGNAKLTRSMFAHDPFSAYEAKTITSPSVLIIGVIGTGKSSLLKTVYVVRPLLLRKHRVVMVDRKDQEGEGEYAELTRALGGHPFKMLIGGGGTVLNVLDPVITAVIGVTGQLGLLRGMIEHVNGGAALEKWENEALRVALLLTLRRCEHEGSVPTLNELVPLLGNMDHDEWDDFSGAAKERIHQAGLGVRFLLMRTVSEELSGLFDGPTSSHVNLNAKLTTFDISQLPDGSPAAGMVMAIAQSWTLGRLRRERGWVTNFGVEEGWDMVSGPIARSLKSQQLLARGLGLSTITAMHHLRQVAANAEGREMLQEPQTIHLFQQDREEDVRACVQNFNLDPQSADTLRNQPQGHHLLKIGNAPEIPIEHVRSDFERRLSDTDAAMLRAMVAA